MNSKQTATGNSDQVSSSSKQVRNTDCKITRKVSFANFQLIGKQHLGDPNSNILIFSFTSS